MPPKKGVGADDDIMKGLLNELKNATAEIGVQKHSAEIAAAKRDISAAADSATKSLDAKAALLKKSKTLKELKDSQIEVEAIEAEMATSELALNAEAKDAIAKINEMRATLEAALNVAMDKIRARGTQDAKNKTAKISKASSKVSSDFEGELNRTAEKQRTKLRMLIEIVKSI